MYDFNPDSGHEEGESVLAKTEKSNRVDVFSDTKTTALPQLHAQLKPD